VIAGAVAGSNSVVEEVTRLMKLWGSSIDPHSAWLIDRGMRTLSVRMERHNLNGMALATWASTHPAIARVHYPGLASHPDHELAKRLLGGYGGMLGLELAGGSAATERMLGRLQLIAHAPSLAGVESLVSNPTDVAPGARPRGRAAMGIPTDSSASAADSRTPRTSSPTWSRRWMAGVIRFAHVFKSYPNGALALKDVSFAINKGEFVFLTGHSGAGKSTILKMLFAEQRPSSGDVRVANYAVQTMRGDDIPKLRRKLGIVFQDFRLLEDRTASENVAFALEVTGARRDIAAARVMRVLTQVGLAAKARAYPRELSGGEQQRVAIARALVNDPAILVADEPTGNLDERATRGVFQLLREINTSGTIVVMATHDLDLVRQTTYRTIEMREGAVVYDSAADEKPDELS
jgi:cell division transport system ATP-binding protein